MLTTIVITALTTAVISFFWVRGIDSMKRKHPNYKGEDFLNWDNQINTAGRDAWDDNIVHTENEI